MWILYDCALDDLFGDNEMSRIKQNGKIVDQ
jgi:hypothetical protein